MERRRATTFHDRLRDESFPDPNTCPAVANPTAPQSETDSQVGISITVNWTRVFALWFRTIYTE